MGNEEQQAQKHCGLSSKILLKCLQVRQIWFFCVLAVHKSKTGFDRFLVCCAIAGCVGNTWSCAQNVVCKSVSLHSVNQLICIVTDLQPCGAK